MNQVKYVRVTSIDILRALNGEMTMNGKKFPVTAGDAILTRTGSSHGLKPLPGPELGLLITYALK